MELKEKMQIKDNLLKCIRICGGVTGKFATMMCDNKEIFKELMEDGQIRKIPVQVKMSDKTIKKMYLYETPVHKKLTQFPSMKEDEAKLISILNNCYYTYQFSAHWFEPQDVKRYVSNTNVKSKKLVPSLMFYEDDKVVAVYVLHHHQKLNESDREIIAKELMVDKVLEYLY